MTLSQAFYVGQNALSLYDFTTGDTDLINGFTADAGVTTSLTGEDQTVTTGDEGSGVYGPLTFFPFEGARLVASADFSNADIRFRIGVQFLDADEVLISESYGDFIASGRRSHQAAVPANTVYVRFFTARDEADGVDASWTFTRPALKTTNAIFSF